MLTLLLLACAGGDKTSDTETTTDTTQTTSTETTDDTQTTDDTETTPTASDTDTATETTDTAQPEGMPLCINEFMPDNESALVLEDGLAPDWIELHNPTDAAVSMAGWTITDNADDAYLLPETLSVPAAGFLVLYATGDPGLGEAHLPFALRSDGGDVALYAPDGQGQEVSYGNIEADFSASRVTDCCAGEGCWDFDFRGSPGVSNVPPVLITETLIAGGGDWLYDDTNTALAATWRTVAYDDSGWSSGTAPLGFGDGHQVTVVASGALERIPTTYFRTTVDITDAASIDALSVGLMLDDGAIVWVNGEEAARVNLPSGLVAHGTFASEAVSEPAEYTFYDYPLDPVLLVDGSNLIAVEVHQASADSSDLTFDLSLTIERPE